MRSVCAALSLLPVRLLAAAAAMACAAASMAAAELPRPAHPGKLTAGVRYVPAPFVGGAKVRTPESTETFLIEDVARQLGLTAQTAPLAADEAPGAQAVDFAVMDLPQADQSGAEGRAAPDGVIEVPTGLLRRPMAIMRTDTDIKTWEQLRGRTVCLARDGLYEGKIAQRYGAIEKVFRAPADALLALRTGGCDAAVHDDVMLRALLAYPEWKKFSASLAPGPAARQVFLVPKENQALAGLLQRMVRNWQSEHRQEKLLARMARDIAFEVYLDQTVPDCH